MISTSYIIDCAEAYAITHLEPVFPSKRGYSSRFCFKADADKLVCAAENVISKLDPASQAVYPNISLESDLKLGLYRSKLGNFIQYLKDTVSDEKFDYDCAGAIICLYIVLRKMLRFN